MEDIKTETNEKCFVSDKPLINPVDDRLGFSKFAEQFANAIKMVDKNECLVYALCGSWGSGKSTCLNFVKSFLENNTTEQDKISIIDFNPWWYSGKQDLLTQFFREFGLAVGQNKDNSEILKTIIKYAEVIAEIPEPTGIAKFLGKILNKSGEELKKKEITEIRKELICKLKESRNKFVVFIDDIDRLDGEEIRDIFKIIKAVGDFPNVVYVLSFDRTVVFESLKNVQPGLPGEEYIEKIVQVIFDLPKPNKSILASFFEKDIEPLLENTPSELYEQKHWQETFLFGIRNYLNTPRNARRLANIIKLIYPNLIGKVNFPDFVAIQVLRLFEPDIYEFIQTRGDMFYGHGEDPYKKLQPFHDAWIVSIPENRREFIKGFLEHLFPKLKSAWSKTTVGHSWLEEWRKKKRVCSPDNFLTYFNLTLAGSQMTDKEIDDLISISNNEKLFSQQLESLGNSDRGLGDGTTRLKTLLQLLPDHLANIPVENFENIIKVFLHIGDDLILPQDETKGLLSWGNDRDIYRIIHLILEKVGTNQERFELLSRCLLGGSAIYTASALVSQLISEIGIKEKLPEYNVILEILELNELKKIVIQNISKNSSNIYSGKTHNPSFVLAVWFQWGKPEDVLSDSKRYLDNVDYQGFTKTMYNFLNFQKSTQYMDDAIVEIKPTIDTTFIPKYFDINQVFGKAKKVINDYPEYKKMNESAAIDLLIKWKEKIEKGESVKQFLGLSDNDY
jgi:predicted KAP-like P-loop ATPase